MVLIGLVLYIPTVILAIANNDVDVVLVSSELNVSCLNSLS